MNRSIVSGLTRWLIGLAIAGWLVVLVSETDIEHAFAHRLSLTALLLSLLAYNFDVLLHSLAGQLGIAYLGYPVATRHHVASTYLSRVARLTGFSASGLAARAAYLRWKCHIPVRVSLLVLTHYQVLGILFLGSIGLVVAILTPNTVIPAVNAPRIAYWITMIALTSIIVLVWVFRSKGVLAAHVRDVFDKVRSLNSAGRYLAVTALGRLVILATQALVLIVVGHEVGLNYWQCIATAAAGALARVLNLVPGSIGVYEGALVGSGAIMGIPSSVALASAIAMRVAEVVTLAVVLPLSLSRSGSKNLPGTGVGKHE